MITLKELVAALNHHVKELSPSDYVGFLSKRLTASSSLAIDRPGHGYHIEITGPEQAMLVFPVVTSSAYLSAATAKPTEKARYTARLAVRINRANLIHVVRSRRDSRPPGFLLTESVLESEEARLSAIAEAWLPASVGLKFSRRIANAQLQMELGTSDDGENFLLLRRLLAPSDYLIFLQREAGAYDVIGLLADDAGGGDLSGYAAADPPKKFELPTAALQSDGVLRALGGAAGSPLQTGAVDDRTRSLAELLARRRNVILYGPPGTGKTYAAFQLAEEWEQQHGAESVVRVTFHPSYSYEEFVQGFRPRPDDPSKFALTDGVLLRAAARAWQSLARGGSVLLLIDEINRADVARVFGELITFLEADKRGVYFSLSQSPQSLYAIPPNLYVLGTMNAADKSISLLDVAMRRRFAFVPFPPDKAVFAQAGWKLSIEGVDIPALLTQINDRLFQLRQDPDRLVGPALLAIDDDDPHPAARLQERIYYDVVPLVEEFCYFDRAVVASVLTGVTDASGRIVPQSEAGLMRALRRLSGHEDDSEGSGAAGGIDPSTSTPTTVLGGNEPDSSVPSPNADDLQGIGDEAPLLEDVEAAPDELDS